ncbi:hypothetical protein LWI28_005462 [Acer negundo]|uniref:Uncharacterized protein n=1 Tax=Acer negundo TaxID=4023 RepID=A0AAD5J9F2_ACENE|nr:hypothetical protein LWI28_005462 [Acer negundo]
MSSGFGSQYNIPKQGSETGNNLIHPSPMHQMYYDPSISAGFFKMSGQGSESGNNPIRPSPVQQTQHEPSISPGLAETSDFITKGQAKPFKQKEKQAQARSAQNRDYQGSEPDSNQKQPETGPRTEPEAGTRKANERAQAGRNKQPEEGHHGPRQGSQDNSHSSLYSAILEPDFARLSAKELVDLELKQT